MKILLVEDEKRLAQSIEYILKKNKYIVDVVYNGEEAIDYAFSKIYDLIILDIMLPKINGTDVLKIIRKEKINIPILLLTAKSSTEDKVTGLDNGADDYLTKPFETNEFLARVRAMLRRKGEIIEEEVIFEDIKLNNNNFTLYCGNSEIPLTLKEFNLMKILISNNKNTVKKEFLIEKIWGFDKDVEYNNLEVYISFLRKKLNLLGSKVEIKTVRGIGYYLEG